MNQHPNVSFCLSKEWASMIGRRLIRAKAKSPARNSAVKPCEDAACPRRRGDRITTPCTSFFAAAHVSACGKRRIAAGAIFERYLRGKSSTEDDYEPCILSDSDEPGLPFPPAGGCGGT